MNKAKLKVLVRALKEIVEELESEVYSDRESYLTYEDYKKLDEKDLNYGQIFEDDE